MLAVGFKWQLWTFKMQIGIHYDEQFPNHIKIHMWLYILIIQRLIEMHNYVINF